MIRIMRMRMMYLADRLYLECSPVLLIILLHSLTASQR